MKRALDGDPSQRAPASPMQSSTAQECIDARSDLMSVGRGAQQNASTTDLALLLVRKRQSTPWNSFHEHGEASELKEQRPFSMSSDYERRLSIFSKQCGVAIFQRPGYGRPRASFCRSVTTELYSVITLPTNAETTATSGLSGVSSTRSISTIPDSIAT